MFAFLSGMAGNVVLGWIWRRVLELAGWLGAVLSIVAAMPPEQQAIIIAILSGQGGGLSIAAMFGFALYLWSQVMSFRATVRPQVVADGHKVGLTEDEARDLVEQQTGRRPTNVVTHR